MSFWRRLVTEAHRRSLWQVLGMYLVASWIGFQVVLALVQGIGLPSWLPGLSAVLFVIGLPVVLATAFVQEGLPSRDADARDTLDPTLFPGAVPDAPGVHDADPSAASTLRRHLTWKRALVAGLVAFALLGVGATGWVAMRALGIGPMASLLAAEELHADARILIADFTPRGVDTTLAAVVTEAFRIDFARSTLIRSVEPAEVRDVLERMGYTEVPRLDADVARQVAIRDGISAYVTGEVTSAGSGYVLTAKLIATEGGALLVALREKAGDDDDVIDAIDELSRALRERTGESLRTIRRAEPLAQVTTASLDALSYYTQGLRASSWEGDPQRARELYEEAVRLDSTFAAAHAALSVHHFNRGEAEDGLAAAERALRFSERLGDLERARIRATYMLARRDYREAVRALERVLEIDPGNFAALNNLGLVHAALGDTARAGEYYQRSVAADTTRFFGYANLGEYLVQVGRLAEAEQAFAKAVQRAPASPWAVVALAQLPWIAGNAREAEQRMLRLVNDPEVPIGVQERAGERLVRMLMTRGRYEEAFARMAHGLRRTDGPDAADAWVTIERIFTEAFVFDRPERAAELATRLPAILEHADDEEMLLWVAQACAAVGSVRCAETGLERAGQAGELKPWSSVDTRFAHAMIAEMRGDLARALHVYSLTDYGCTSCMLPFVGRVLEKLQLPDSAAATYERFIRSTSTDRIFVDPELAPIHERLARYYEARNEPAQAARHYARFVELWEDADEELQPRVARARQRLAGLRSDR